MHTILFRLFLPFDLRNMCYFVFVCVIKSNKVAWRMGLKCDKRFEGFWYYCKILNVDPSSMEKGIIFVGFLNVFDKYPVTHCTLSLLKLLGILQFNDSRFFWMPVILMMNTIHHLNYNMNKFRVRLERAVWLLYPTYWEIYDHNHHLSRPFHYPRCLPSRGHTNTALHR